MQCCSPGPVITPRLNQCTGFRRGAVTATRCGELRCQSGRRWKMEDGRWKSEDHCYGRWKMEDGRWKTLCGRPASISHLPSPLCAPMTDSAPPIPAVQTFGLTRMYGTIAALSGLDLTVNKGDLFGFIGSNGAGKTTTLRILATFLAPSAGRAQILGHDVVRDADAVRHVIGYMPDFFGVYKDMEVTEYLDFFGACYKIPTAQREKTVNDVLELVGLSEKKGALIGALSRGMQQRLGLARVLIHDPQVLLLDEPASGLDPRARIEMMAILQELQKMGTN